MDKDGRAEVENPSIVDLPAGVRGGKPIYNYIASATATESKPKCGLF
jgi:hypothetical protein